MSTETLESIPSSHGLTDQDSTPHIDKTPELIEVEHAFTRLKAQGCSYAEIALRLNTEAASFTLSHSLIEAFFARKPHFAQEMTFDEQNFFLYCGATHVLTILYNRIYAAEHGLIEEDVEYLETQIRETEEYCETLLIQSDEEAYYPEDAILLALQREETE